MRLKRFGSPVSSEKVCLLGLDCRIYGYVVISLASVTVKLHESVKQSILLSVRLCLVRIAVCVLCQKVSEDSLNTLHCHNVTVSHLQQGCAGNHCSVKKVH